MSSKVCAKIVHSINVDRHYQQKIPCKPGREVLACFRKVLLMNSSSLPLTPIYPASKYQRRNRGTLQSCWTIKTCNFVERVTSLASWASLSVLPGIYAPDACEIPSIYTVKCSQSLYHWWTRGVWGGLWAGCWPCPSESSLFMSPGKSRMEVLGGLWGWPCRYRWSPPIPRSISTAHPTGSR